MSADKPNPSAPGIDASPDQLERLFDAALDAVIAMDSNGAIAAWNKTAETVFGWTRPEVLGRQLAEIVIPESLRPAHHAGLERYHASKTGPVINARVEVTAMRRDGSEFPVELTVIPLQLDGGEIFYAFLRDITARKQAERLAGQRALEAHVLYEAASLVAQGGSADALLAHCLAKICEVTGWSVGHVYSPDDVLKPTRLVSTDNWYIAEPRLESLRAASHRPLRRGEGLPGRIWAEGAPVWIEDLQADPDLPRGELLARHDLRAAFGVPIMLEDQLQAVLEFFSPVAQRPDDSLMLVAQSLAEQLGRVLERQRALEHQQLLMRELDHRVSNSLTVVASMFRRTAQRAGSVCELKETFESRLHTLAGAHHVLARGAWTSASLRDVFESTLGAFATNSDYVLEGPDVRLPARQVVDLTMVLHELATNAAKYGALSVVGGQVAITWRETGADQRGEHGGPAAPSRVAIAWQESGGPAAHPPRQRGYGLDLIEGLITRGMGGQVDLEFGPHGLQVRMVLPISNGDLA
ncbi:MAG TPA: PAS domain S-box protein [Aestuariivirgaceae bacterium]|nr:PAS domain S-box protein [Aestuariivirgaceae bacterium]